MTKQHINIGQSANDKAGDPLRTAFSKVNDNFDELYNHVSAGVIAGATAPTDPGEGDLWWDSESGRIYVYYGSTWVDASPVDGAGINSTNELVNGNKTVSLDPNGLTTFPTFQTGTESLYLQGTEFGSVNSGVAIAAKNQIILAANVLGNQKNWNFGTEGKLTLPAGTTYEYLNAPLTGHGDGLARLDFTLVTDGVDTQWAAASASPAGSGYNIGDTFTFDAEFLGIPGASVTIEVLTIGVGGGVENLAFTQPPLYPADIYRDSPINLQVGPESNRWTFGATGTTTFPVGVSIKSNGLNYRNIVADTDLALTIIASGNSGSAAVNWSHSTQQAGIQFNNFGAGSKARATITASNNVNKIWVFDEDGALTFPDALSIKDSVIGKASTNTITEGEASQTTAIESQIEITTTGVVIAKRTSVTVNDGVITTVNDSGSTLELDNTHASITYYIEPDGPDNNSLIQFTTDSSAGGGATIETVTEDVGGTAHGRVRAAGNSVQVSAKTFLGTNKTWSFTGAGDLQLPESGNILSNGANYIDLANFETSYNDAEGAYQDALTAWMTLETFRPVWFALPGRLAYDEMIAWTPTTGQPALPLNLPPVAKNAQDSYAAWQETIALSKLTVASDIAEFDFNSTGKLRLPQGGTVGGGDQADIDAAYDDWQADEAAWQYLITTGGADFNVRPWNFAGPSRAEKQAIVLSMWQAQQSGAAIDWVPISSAFYNEARAWLAITANQDGYENWKKLTTSVNITSEDNTWSFTNDGALTLPDNSVIASYKPVTVIAQTTTAQTITDSASAAFIQFVDTVDTASAYSTGTFTAPYTGYYQINMSIYFSTTVTLNSGSFLLIDTNLDNTKQVTIINGSWSSSYLHYSTVIPATAGDAIRVAFRQVSGADIDVASGSRLTIHRVSIS